MIFLSFCQHKTPMRDAYVVYRRGRSVGAGFWGVIADFKENFKKFLAKVRVFVLELF